MTIRENKDYVRVLWYSYYYYYITIALCGGGGGGGVFLKYTTIPDQQTQQTPKGTTDAWNHTCRHKMESDIFLQGKLRTCGARRMPHLSSYGLFAPNPAPTTTTKTNNTATKKQTPSLQTYKLSFNPTMQIYLSHEGLQP